MTIDRNPSASSLSASKYILDNFEPIDRIAMLVLNRDLGEVLPRVTTARKASSPKFQAWLRYKTATGSDIYLGMNPLRKHASTRTEEDIKSIRVRQKAFCARWPGSAAEIPLPPTRRACCVCLVLPTRNMKRISLSRFAKYPSGSIVSSAMQGIALNICMETR